MSRQVQERTSQSRSYDQDVSQFMRKVYLWMTFGLLLSGGIAYYICNHPAIEQSILSQRWLFNSLLIAQLACVISFSFLQKKCSSNTATALFLLYCALTGVTFSVIFSLYSQSTITEAFFVTAGSFFALSLFGYATKRDLGPIGSFCYMGLFGMIIVMLMGFFIPSFRSDMMQMVIASIGVLVFSGLTAYDTQKIKARYHAEGGGKVAAVSGALTLYLDFINLFLSLLRLFGGRR